MSTASVPQELIDLIIDQLGSEINDSMNGAYTALVQCALASRAFRTPSHRHIFSTISLTWGPSRTIRQPMIPRDQALLELLTSNEGLKTFIRILVVQAYRWILPAKAPSRLSTIITILYSSPGCKLHTFRLVSPGMQWGFLDDALRSSICNLCLSGHLTALSLEGILEVPLGLLEKCHAGIEALSLNRVTFGGHPRVATLGTGQNLRIRPLTVKADAYFNDLMVSLEKEYPALHSAFLCRMRDFTHTQTMRHDSFEAWKELVPSLISIQTLQLNMNYFLHDDFHKGVDFAHLRSLRTLTLHMNTPVEFVCLATPCISHLLLRPSIPNSIETVNVFLDVDWLLLAEEDSFRTNIHMHLFQPCVSATKYPALSSLTFQIASKDLDSLGKSPGEYLKHILRQPLYRGFNTIYDDTTLRLRFQKLIPF